MKRHRTTSRKVLDVFSVKNQLDCLGADGRDRLANLRSIPQKNTHTRNQLIKGQTLLRFYQIGDSIVLLNCHLHTLHRILRHSRLILPSLRRRHQIIRQSLLRSSYRCLDLLLLSPLHRRLLASPGLQLSQNVLRHSLEELSDQAFFLVRLAFQLALKLLPRAS